jgi:hypothetical protein
MPNPTIRYGHLGADYLITTVTHLAQRIEERFPDRGLTKVAQHLVTVAKETEKTAARIRRGAPLYKPFTLLLTVSALLASAWGAFLLQQDKSMSLEIRTVTDFLTIIETAVSIVVFVGAAILFLMSIDNKRRRSLTIRKVHELRCIAHVVDMHQLHKDPDRIDRKGANTKSSPMLEMSAFELGRYLDYCSELLALTGKIGALYVQGYEDPVAVSAVDQLESLTTGLSRKIWQKIMILDRLEWERSSAKAASAPPIPLS